MKIKVIITCFIIALIVGMLSVVYKSQHTRIATSNLKPSGMTIGILSLSSNPSHELLVDAFKTEIMKTGQNVRFIQETVTENAAFPQAARRLVAQQPDIIVANSTPATNAASAATSTIPIVFGGVGDPVGNGIVASLDSSGSNLTGISSLSVELTAKRLEMLHTLFPLIKSVFFIYQPNEVGSENSRKKIEESAQKLHIALVERPVNSVSEADAVSQSMRASQAQALLIAANGMIWSGQKSYIQTQDREHIPVVGVDNLMAENGAVFSYGPNYQLMGVQIAKIVQRVHEGTPPQYIPIQRPDKVEFIVNKKVADAIGILFTADQLKSADRVINQ